MAEPVVAGTGYRIPTGGDDFEDEKWSFQLASPKSSEEQDKNQRLPGGISRNGKWQESACAANPI